MRACAWQGKVTCPWTSLWFLRKTCGSVARDRMLPITGMGDGPGGKPGGLLCLKSWRVSRKAKRATAKQNNPSRTWAPADTGTRDGDLMETIVSFQNSVWAAGLSCSLQPYLTAYKYHLALFLTPASRPNVGELCSAHDRWSGSYWSGFLLVQRRGRAIVRLQRWPMLCLQKCIVDEKFASCNFQVLTCRLGFTQQEHAKKRWCMQENHIQAPTVTTGTYVGDLNISGYNSGAGSV